MSVLHPVSVKSDISDNLLKNNELKSGLFKSFFTQVSSPLKYNKNPSILATDHIENWKGEELGPAEINLKTKGDKK